MHFLKKYPLVDFIYHKNVWLGYCKESIGIGSSICKKKTGHRGTIKSSSGKYFIWDFPSKFPYSNSVVGLVRLFIIFKLTFSPRKKSIL